MKIAQPNTSLTESTHRHLSHGGKWIFIALAASSMVLSGCNRDQATPDATQSDAPKQPTAIATNPPPTKEVMAPITPEAGIERVQQAFTKSPQETRARIDQAISIIQSGKIKEGIGHLKMVDAEFDLDAQQQESIKDLIRAVR